MPEPVPPVVEEISKHLEPLKDKLALQLYWLRRGEEVTVWALISEAETGKLIAEARAVIAAIWKGEDDTKTKVDYHVLERLWYDTDGLNKELKETQEYKWRE